MYGGGEKDEEEEEEKNHESGQQEIKECCSKSSKILKTSFTEVKDEAICQKSGIKWCFQQQLLKTNEQSLTS